MLLIADEVIDGWGRCGTWFADGSVRRHSGHHDDGQGLSSGYAPIAATVVTSRRLRSLQGKPRCLPRSPIDLRWSPVAAAAALKNIEIMEEEKLPERAAEMGAYLRNAARRASQLPDRRRCPWCRHAAALDLVSDKEERKNFGRGHKFTDRVSDLLNERRIPFRVWGVLNIAPPLIATKAKSTASSPSSTSP